MSLEPAESAAIRVWWADARSAYELRWYNAPGFVVPVWWLGVSDLEGALVRTRVLAPKTHLQGELFEWLLPQVGGDGARQLTSLATDAPLAGVEAAS